MAMVKCPIMLEGETLREVEMCKRKEMIMRREKFWKNKTMRY